MTGWSYERKQNFLLVFSQNVEIFDLFSRNDKNMAAKFFKLYTWNSSLNDHQANDIQCSETRSGKRKKLCLKWVFSIIGGLILEVKTSARMVSEPNETHLLLHPPLPNCTDSLVAGNFLDLKTGNNFRNRLSNVRNPRICTRTSQIWASFFFRVGIKIRLIYQFRHFCTYRWSTGSFLKWNIGVLMKRLYASNVSDLRSRKNDV